MQITEFCRKLQKTLDVFFFLYNVNNRLILKTSKLGIDTEIYGDTVIDSSNITLEPIIDSTVVDNINNVLRINFNVRGETNNVKDVIYDIALTNLNIDCELLSKYLKWELYKNNELLSSGNMSPEFDTIVDDRLVLTNIQENLIPYSEEADHYEFRMWLSDNYTVSNANKNFEIKIGVRPIN